MDKCMWVLKRSSKKREIQRFVCGNLGTCFWYKNIQLIAFANDKELFNRLIIIFMTFDVVRNYYFFFDVPLPFFDFFLYSHSVCRKYLS